MVFTRLLQMIIFSYLTLSCDKGIEESCQFNGCDSRRQTIKMAEKSVGKMAVLSQQSPNIWVVISDEGIIGEDTNIIDGPDIVIICNMPDSLKISGLTVEFSGELKSSCNDFPKGLSNIYYCQPSKLVSKTKNG